MKIFFVFIIVGVSSVLQAAVVHYAPGGLTVRQIDVRSLGMRERHKLFYNVAAIAHIKDKGRAEVEIARCNDQFERFTKRPHCLFEVCKGSLMIGQLLINTENGSLDIVVHKGDSQEEKKMVRALLLVHALQVDMLPSRIFYVTYGPPMEWHTLFGFQLIDAGPIEGDGYAGLETATSSLRTEWLRYEVERGLLATTLVCEVPSLCDGMRDERIRTSDC